MMGTIISILDHRSSLNPEGLDAKICLLAHKIIEITTEHQKRVIKIMPEFDLHDATHLKKVEENIASLIGDARMDELSSTELFLLLAASYLHDCGMAPADYELALMKMTEGYKSEYPEKSSICNDGRRPFSIKEAKRFIENNKSSIYNFHEVQNWEFAPNNENQLKDYLAEILVNYQNFRNGFCDIINDSVNATNYVLLNDNIRVEYIRTFHHKKSAKYIKNLQRIATTILGGNWVKRLFSDLADICQSHGENIDFVRTLKKDNKYVDTEEANLQFVSMMLRLGDIIHYSSDRAPSVLRNAMSFYSEYSKNEWLTKVGLNYTIKDGIVVFMANCEAPKDYYHLQEYLDWVDDEINNFDFLKRGWQSKYKININAVNRDNVTYNKSSFIPVKDKKFTLSQNKIIELLMGVKLYKDPFSSIRELYQNALDACRCRLEIESTKKISMEGEIEFGIDREDDGLFLYCKDNGIGMDEYIIENYLLKIGNSFYNSKDFYRKRSQWDSSYTPVSQFGIGILSCFIIGSRIEIITKSIENSKCTVCCIDGASESFYYKMPSRDDSEQLPDCGTLVKVFLRPQYENKINNLPISKLGLVLQYKAEGEFIGDFEAYNSIYDVWKDSLYHFLNDYVNSIPYGINLQVRFSDDTVEKIYNKPFTVNIGDLGIEAHDQAFIDKVIQRGTFHEYNGSIVELQKHLKLYPIHIKTESIEYNSLIALPLPGMQTIDRESLLFRFLKVEGSRLSIDGISVEDRASNRDNYYNRLKHNGSINYIGSIRPQLSVDRREIVFFPFDYSNKYRDVVEKEIISTLEIARNHIKQYNLLENSSTTDLIWSYIFNRMGCAQSIFVNNFANSELGNIYWPSIKKLIGRDMTIDSLLSLNEIVLYQYDHTQLDDLSRMLVFALFISAEKVEAIDDKTIKIMRNPNSQIPETEEFWRHSRYLVPAEENAIFNEYDIISNLYPIVPQRLISRLKHYDTISNSRAVEVPACGNCYNELFFQDSRLVNPGIGIYGVGMTLGQSRDSYIHAFENIKHKFQCMDFDISFPRGKTCVPYLAYIAPSVLTVKDKEILESIKVDEPIYYRGINEGWTLLVTNMEIDNIIIQPGKVGRNTMVGHICDQFWEEYSDWTFQFLDGTEMRKTKG